MSFPLTPPGRPAALKRLRATALAGGIALSFALVPFVEAQTNAPPQPLTPSPHAMAQLPSFAPLVKQVMPAVVNISVVMKSNAPGGEQEQAGPNQGPFPGFPPSPFDEFLRKFFEQQRDQQDGDQGDNDQDGNGGGGGGRGMQRVALGSGFIIDPSGYIVTNNHVVQNADKVTVVFQDDTRHPAKVIGRDAKTDLALIKIDANGHLPYVPWGDSNAMQVGDWVVAVGNPFGLGGTVSSGIISARGRDIHSGPYDDFLQIDASINRGNSGGPTFNLEGQVIGINTAIYSPTGGSVGIGFAIPASLAKPVIEQLREHGKVERGWLGVQIQQVTPEIAKSLGLPKDEGALVADVTPDGPAAKAGFKQGDVIMSFNGHAVNKVRDLPILVAETPVGQKADVKIWRQGKEEDLHPTIGPMPENPQVAQNGNGQGGGNNTAQNASAMGLKLAPLNDRMRQRLHVPKGVKGVVVTAIDDNSPLADLGIEPGDVIEQIDQQPVTTPHEVVQKLEQAQNKKGPAKNLLLLLNRHGVNQYVALSIENQQGSGSSGRNPG